MHKILKYNKIVWSGGMDSKLYEWDFSRGAPVNIHDMSK